MIKLIIFDVDGTLAKQHSVKLLPGVKEFFHLVFQGNCRLAIKTAIATNQGGVGMRYWMEHDHFGWPLMYPTAKSVDDRLRKLLTGLGAADHAMPVYVSYSYINREGKWGPIPESEAENPRWQSTWRKPQPGMLQQAMRDLDAAPDETLYVGDRDEDKGAAKAAGCAFMWAKDFFSQTWDGCEALTAAVERDHATRAD